MQSSLIAVYIIRIPYYDALAWQIMSHSQASIAYIPWHQSKAFPLRKCLAAFFMLVYFFVDSNAIVIF